MRAFVALALVGAMAGRAVADTERELGRRFLLEVRSQLPLVDDPAVINAVRAIGDRIVTSLGPQEFDYHFFVVKHPSLNAFAVPGGYIFVFSGLIARSNNEDELAGVMGHEAAHVHAHHILRQQQAGMPWTVASLLGLLLSAVHPALAAGALAAAQTAQLKFSREFEQEADFVGLRLLGAAGYDPKAIGGFFKHLLVEQRLNPVAVPPWLLTHPVTEDRLTNLEAVVASQKLKTPPGRPTSSLGFEEAKAVARVTAEPSEDVITAYRKEVDKKPKEAKAHFLLGRVYMAAGQHEAARASLERARDLGGLGGAIDRPLGIVYLKVNDPRSALTVLRQHVSRQPNDPYGRLELGRALLETNDTSEALIEFQRALRLDEDLDEAHRQVGLVLGRQGKEGEGFFHLAMGERLRGELPQALQHFDRAAELMDPSNPKHAQAEDAIDELKPLVRDIEVRQREEERRRRRR